MAQIRATIAESEDYFDIRLSGARGQWIVYRYQPAAGLLVFLASDGLPDTGFLRFSAEQALKQFAGQLSDEQAELPATAQKEDPLLLVGESPAAKVETGWYIWISSGKPAPAKGPYKGEAEAHEVMQRFQEKYAEKAEVLLIAAGTKLAGPFKSRQEARRAG